MLMTTYAARLRVGEVVRTRNLIGWDEQQGLIAAWSRQESPAVSIR
jgi:hypothetical protein